jgi:hypothetical protein
MYDGTHLAGPADLAQALLQRRRVLLQNFTENLMTFALGRRLAAEDMPAVRKIVRDAGADTAPTSAYVLGIVKSAAFRMKSVESVTTTAGVAGQR